MSLVLESDRSLEQNVHFFFVQMCVCAHVFLGCAILSVALVKQRHWMDATVYLHRSIEINPQQSCLDTKSLKKVPEPID